MRIALIATPDREAGDSAEPAMLAGKSIARHQLDFALALGCRSVICLGHGAASETISLRHAAEASGAATQTSPAAVAATLNTRRPLNTPTS